MSLLRVPHGIRAFWSQPSASIGTGGAGINRMLRPAWNRPGAMRITLPTNGGAGINDNETLVVILPDLTPYVIEFVADPGDASGTQDALIATDGETQTQLRDALEVVLSDSVFAFYGLVPVDVGDGALDLRWTFSDIWFPPVVTTDAGGITLTPIFGYRWGYPLFRTWSRSIAHAFADIDGLTDDSGVSPIAALWGPKRAVWLNQAPPKMNAGDFT